MCMRACVRVCDLCVHVSMHTFMCLCVCVVVSRRAHTHTYYIDLQLLVSTHPLATHFAAVLPSPQQQQQLSCSQDVAQQDTRLRCCAAAGLRLTQAAPLPEQQR